MPDYFGPVRALELASLLWLIPGLAFAAALAAAVRVDTGRRAKVSTALAVALSGGVSIAYAARVAVHVGGANPFQHLWPCVRVGAVDIGLDLTLDRIAAGFAACVAAVGAWALVRDARSLSPREGSRAHAWFAALTGALFLVVLEGNLVLLVAGWEAVGLLFLALVRASVGGDAPVRGGEAVTVVDLASGASLALASGLLFWGLGGGWTAHGDYQPDLAPRVVAVAVPASGDAPAGGSKGGAVATSGEGFLTVEGLPGSLVYEDDSRAPMVDEAGLPLRTPFRRRVITGGVHSFRVAPDDRVGAPSRDSHARSSVEGGVLPNYALTRLAFGNEHEIALAVTGATLEVREMQDALAFEDGRGGRPIREAVLARRMLGAPLVSVASAFVLLAVALRLLTAVQALHTVPAGVPLARASAALLTASALYLVTRMAFLLALPNVARDAGLFALGVGALATFATRASTSRVEARSDAS